MRMAAIVRVLAVLSVTVFAGCTLSPAVHENSLESKTLRVPAGFLPKVGTEAEPYTNTRWARETVHERTGIELVFIPAGKFMMGSPPDEAWRWPEEAQHEVVISKPFYMGKYEVTQGQWMKIMEMNPSDHKGDDRLPVESVAWSWCQEFLEKAGGGMQLPREVQWEYACRAGTTTPFNTGETIGTDQANYNGNEIYGRGQQGAESG